MNYPEKTPTIDTLEDLRDATTKGLFTWGTPKGTILYSMFKVTLCIMRAHIASGFVRTS
jgi:hypothetical protein